MRSSSWLGRRRDRVAVVTGQPRRARTAILAAAITAAVAITVAGCSGGSAPAGRIVAPPSGKPTTLAPSEPPSDATTSVLDGTATLHSSASGSYRFRTDGSDRVQVFTTPQGDVSLKLSMTGPGGSVFSWSGGATTAAPVTGARINAVAPSRGLYFDSTESDAGSCRTTFTAADSHQIAADVTCRLDEPVVQTVTAHFSAS
jgi:hypothetical protein